MWHGAWVIAVVLVCVANANVAIYTPTDGILSASAFYNYVVNQVKAGQKYIQLAPGTYEVPSATAVNDQAHLVFDNLEGIQVDMTNVHLILTDRKRGGIYISQCTKFRLTGVTLSWKVPCSFQGTIDSIVYSGSNTLYNVTIHNGYDVTDLKEAASGGPQTAGYIFDPQTRWWKAGNWDMYVAKTRYVSGQTFELTFNGKLGPKEQNVKVGDFMAFRGTAGGHGIFNGNGNANIIEGATLHDAGVFGYFDAGGQGANTYTAINIRRGVAPEGATQTPLLSTCADGLHSAGARHGPIISKAFFEGMPDDGIAVHGTFSLIMSASGQYLNVTDNGFVAGDVLRLYDNEFNRIADYTLVSVTPLPSSYVPPKDVSVTEPRFNLNQRGIFSTLKLSAPVDPKADFDWLISDPFSEGMGYKLLGNSITNHRARGLLLKASNGVVSGNTIDGSTMAGIAIFPELYWNEADYSRNLVVEQNIIKNVAYHIAPVGGLIISAVDPQNKSPTGYGHMNISVLSNTIENVNYTNLVVNSGSNIVVQDNQFINPLQRPAVVSSNIFPGNVVVYMEDAQVKISNNCLKNVGPASAKPPAVFGPAVSSNVPVATGFKTC